MNNRKFKFFLYIMSWVLVTVMFVLTEVNMLFLDRLHSITIITLGFLVVYLMITLYLHLMDKVTGTNDVAYFNERSATFNKWYRYFVIAVCVAGTIYAFCTQVKVGDAAVP